MHRAGADKANGVTRQGKKTPFRARLFPQSGPRGAKKRTESTKTRGKSGEMIKKRSCQTGKTGARIEGEESAARPERHGPDGIRTTRQFLKEETS